MFCVPCWRHDQHGDVFGACWLFSCRNGDEHHTPGRFQPLQQTARGYLTLNLLKLGIVSIVKILFNVKLKYVSIDISSNMLVLLNFPSNLLNFVNNNIDIIIILHLDRSVRFLLQQIPFSSSILLLLGYIPCSTTIFFRLIFFLSFTN